MENTGNENDINFKLEFAFLVASLRDPDFSEQDDGPTREILNLVFFDQEQEFTERDRIRSLVYHLLEHSSATSIASLAVKDKRIFTLLKHIRIEHLNCADIYGINKEFLSKVGKTIELIKSIKPEWK